MKLKLKLKNKLKNPAKVKSRQYDPFDPRETGVSQTLLGMHAGCDESTRLKYIQGFRSIESKVPFIQGDAYHQCLEEIINSHINETDPMEAVAEKLKQLKEKSIKSGLVVQQESIAQVCDLAESMFTGYLEHWSGDQLKDWNFAEHQFSVDFTMSDGCVIPFKGKIDAGFNFGETRQSEKLVEHKFLSRWGAGLIDTLPMNLQNQAYCLARETPHVLYDLVRKPQLRRKKEESRKTFNERILADIRIRPEFYYERHDISFTSQEMKDNRAHLQALIQEFYSWWKKQKTVSGVGRRSLTYNSGSCDGKYGTCEYLDICANRNSSSFKQLAIKK